MRTVTDANICHFYHWISSQPTSTATSLLLWAEAKPSPPPPLPPPKGLELGCSSSAVIQFITPFLPQEFPQCDEGLDVQESVSMTQTRCALKSLFFAALIKRIPDLAVNAGEGMRERFPPRESEVLAFTASPMFTRTFLSET